VLKKLHIKGFKSLADTQVEFPRLTVLFGPNAAGKSNLLEAVQLLSRIGTSRTLADVLAESIRGYPLEAFALPPGGLPELVRQQSARFTFDATVGCEPDTYQYRIGIQIQPGSGSLTVQDEYLAKLAKSGDAKGNAAIERVDDQLRVRRKSKPAHPRQETLGLNHTMMSDPRFNGEEYRSIELCRSEFEGWRSYYLDPRVARRGAHPPADVRNIGVLGENISPFLYRLRAQYPKHFDSIKRSLRTLIPSIEDLNIDLDEKRGTLDIQIRQDGTDYSSRIISEYPAGSCPALPTC
jgi:predicted ATPase